MAAATTPAQPVPPPYDPAELAFYRQERARLSTEGFTDYAEVNAELSRRWKFMQRPKSTPGGPLRQALPDSPESMLTGDDGTIRLQGEALTDEEAAAQNLVLVTVEAGPPETLVYMPMSSFLTSSATAASGPLAAIGESHSRSKQDTNDSMAAEAAEMVEGALASMKRKKRIVVQTEEASNSDASTSSGVSSVQSSTLKRARTEPSASDLVRRLKKDTLQSICEDLETTVSGNKEELMLKILSMLE